MNPTPHPGELRPPTTPDIPPALLLRLRGSGAREPIPPEDCLLGDRCLVCAWRKAGLLDLPPRTRAA